MNLAKDLKDLYTINNKTLMKEIEEATKMERYPIFMG